MKLIKALWLEQQPPARGVYGIIIVEKDGKRQAIMGRSEFTTVQTENEEIDGILKSGAIITDDMLYNINYYLKAVK